MKTPLNISVLKNIPDFIREDYPAYVEFIKAYYEYVNQYEKRNLEDLKDIDRTLDDFIQYFKAELDVYGQTNYDYIDSALLLRNIKQVFVAKGTPAAYEFLFKIIYGRSTYITYPWDSVLRASDGKWQRDVSIFAKSLIPQSQTQEAITDAVGNYIYIVGPNRKIKVLVKSVRLYRDDIYEVFIDRNYYGNIGVNENIELNGAVVGIIVPTVVKYYVENAGIGYKVGDVLSNTTISNGVSVTQLLKITQVSSTGGVEKLEVIQYGAGYTTDFYLYRANIQGAEKSNFTVVKNASTLLNIPNDSFIDQYLEYGSVNRPNYWTTTNEVGTNGINSYSSTSYAGQQVTQFSFETINQEAASEYTLIRFEIGAVAKYAGYYSKNDGFLSDEIRLQDSKYWQKYSYVIHLDDKLSNYKSLIMTYLHPAGTALFGSYDVVNVFDENSLSVSMDVVT